MENLPQSVETHDQERRSVIKFTQVVPIKLFILREESGLDYGVDKILEVRKDDILVTNYRVYVQLKSVLIGERNEDNSYSYSVPISTLNYLMNQPNAIFVIYLENEDILLWD